MSFYDTPDAWVDRKLLSNRRRLEGINSAIYVMQSLGEGGLYRSGVIGIQQQNNNAWKRLSQLNKGDLKSRGPWQFAFLAPLPVDLWRALADAEAALQSALAENFEVGKRGLFYTSNESEVVKVAQSATREFLKSLRKEGADDFLNALAGYAKAVSAGGGYDNPARQDVIVSFRSCLDGKLADRIMKALHEPA